MASTSRTRLVPEIEDTGKYDGKYVLVPAPGGAKDTKDSKKSSVGSLLKNQATNKGLGYFRKPFPVKACVAYNDSSAANTALSTVRTLKPGDTTEWSSFANLFDEARCTGLEIHTLVTIGAAAMASGTVCDWACAFDPSDNGVYTNVTNIIPSAHRIGPFRIWPQAPLQGVSAVSTDGIYHVWRVPLNKMVTLNPTTSAEIVGGGWFATQDSTAIIGFLKPYVLAAGAGGQTSTISHYVVFHMEFRTRT